MPTILSAPTAATSGTILTVKWTTTNDGTAPTLAGWVDSAYLSTTGQVTSSSLLLGTVTISRAAGAASEHRLAPPAATIPPGDSGTYQIIVVSDATNQLIEPNGTANTASQAINITIAPYAVLAVSNVTAPAQTIGDPAYPTISWTVTNIGTGAGQTTTWTDAVIASPTGNVDDPDAVVLGTFVHAGGLAVNQSYTQTQTFAMPPGFSGRYHLFVEADSGDAVFMNGLRTASVGEDPNHFDVMPIPYADLVVTSIAVPQPAGSGRSLDVTWTIKNQGIGLTSVPSWDDDLALASDPAGQDIVADYGLFNHLGPIGPGESYTRTAQITLPDGLSGTYYFVVTAAANNPPYEFIYGNGTDNITVSQPFTIDLTPPPDLAVTSVGAPTTAQEGSTIQVGWTVQDVGTGAAGGDWEDEVVLAPIDQPAGTPDLVVGTFDILQRPGARQVVQHDRGGHPAGPHQRPVQRRGRRQRRRQPVRGRRDRQQHRRRLAVDDRHRHAPARPAGRRDRHPLADRRRRLVRRHLHDHQPGQRPHDRQLGRQGLPLADAGRRGRLDPDPGPARPVGLDTRRGVPGDHHPGHRPPAVQRPGVRDRGGRCRRPGRTSGPTASTAPNTGRSTSTRYRCPTWC